MSIYPNANLDPVLTFISSNCFPRGNTGNFIVDFCNGREFNPFFAGGDLKLLYFRVSMIGLAVVNTLLVLDDFYNSRGRPNYGTTAAGAFQV